MIAGKMQLKLFKNNVQLETVVLIIHLYLEIALTFAFFPFSFSFYLFQWIFFL